ncbi:heat shock 70 kDa protein 12A [Rhizoctonia solani AG-3 Rhs1AP]|uniref:Heat shock 70 kDa protein 12A n=2 Tax=Rhizoctonia solani AG-3 TaxID=1086053 RepID=A0A074SN65_9AGAM|nr:heat shock 70 kDa protein 12A [Rhizoctonia solani AG-3 Rhs1AP]KEP51487.1 heat shock 70 kDa protein 12A [Rhizoctonia solani 123E]
MGRYTDEPWTGEPKLILGIDLGTTHSAVSFSYLLQGDRQVVRRVGKWPGQEAHKEHSKIPTLVYYDKNNEPQCFGAETLTLDARDQADEEGWSLAKYFKLHLHPQSMRTQDRLTLYPLPFGVSLAKIYTDFLGYLLRHTRTYFEEHVIHGSLIWEKCATNMLIVLAHPNGWSTREQSFMKQSLMEVGPEYKNYQVTFVTEGEASVHFCMYNSNMDSALEPQTDLIVCDAGGSTVDTTAYRVEKTLPMLELREQKASACIQAGGVFVDLEWERYLNRLLSIAGLSGEDLKDYLNNGIRDFEARAKQEFESADVTHQVDFDDRQFTKEMIGIKKGRMALKGSIVETFFDPVVSSTIRSLKQQMQGLKPQHLLLVGGFGESKYLRSRLRQEFEKDGCRVAIVDDSTSKAAADGSVIWASKLSVVGRVTRTSYGTVVRTRYDPSNPDHQGRKVTRGNGGYGGVAGKWSEIVAEGVTLNAQESARRKFIKSYKPGKYTDLEKYTDEIWVYYGVPGTNPGWIEDKDGNTNPGFEKLCTVTANLDGKRAALLPRTGTDGPYEVLEFWLAIQAGGTELCARIEWVEKGKQEHGPVTIMPEPIDPLPNGGNVSG